MELEINKLHAELEKSKADIIYYQSQLREMGHLLKNTAVHYFSINEQGGVIEINDSALSELGFQSKEEIQSVHSFLVEDDKRKIDNFIKNLSFQGGMKKVETYFRKVDGHAFKVALRGAAYYDADGNFVQIHCFWDAIENAGFFKRKYEYSEKKFLQVFQHLNKLVLFLDQKGYVLFCNQYLQERLNYSEPDIMDKNWIDEFVPANHRSHVRKELMGMNYDSRISTYVENEVFSYVGERRLIAWNNSVYFDEEKNENVFICIGVDITEQKRVEQTLTIEMRVNKSITELSRMILSDDSSLLMIDKEVHSVIRQLTNSPKALVGTYSDSGGMIRCCLDVDEQEDVWSKIYEVENDQSLWLVNNKGRKISMIDDAQMVLHPERLRISRMLSVPVIVSEQLVGQLTVFNAFRKYNAADVSALTRVADVYALAIKSCNTRKELVGAKERAEQSDSLKSAFLANMSHEIRTPMNGMLGFIDLLKQKEFDDATLDSYLETISSCGDQLLHIINDILDISRIEVGQLKIVKEDVTLECILEGVNKIFQSESVANKRPKVEWQIVNTQKERNILLSVDRFRLMQIFNNLISNSYKFTEKGMISLTVGHFNRNSIEFIVKDTGVGIPEDCLGLIFKRFNKREHLISRGRSGVGLGLSIVKGLIELLSGTIEIESSEGKGTEVRLIFPAFEGNANL